MTIHRGRNVQILGVPRHTTGAPRKKNTPGAPEESPQGRGQDFGRRASRGGPQFLLKAYAETRRAGVRPRTQFGNRAPARVHSRRVGRPHHSTEGRHPDRASFKASRASVYLFFFVVIFVSSRASVYIYICIHIYIHIYICMCTYIHMHIRV